MMGICYELNPIGVIGLGMCFQKSEIGEGIMCGSGLHPDAPDPISSLEVTECHSCYCIIVRLMKMDTISQLASYDVSDNVHVNGLASRACYIDAHSIPTLPLNAINIPSADSVIIGTSQGDTEAFVTARDVPDIKRGDSVVVGGGQINAKGRVTSSYIAKFISYDFIVL